MLTFQDRSGHRIAINSPFEILVVEEGAISHTIIMRGGKHYLIAGDFDDILRQIASGKNESLKTKEPTTRVPITNTAERPRAVASRATPSKKTSKPTKKKSAKWVEGEGIVEK